MAHIRKYVAWVVLPNPIVSTMSDFSRYEDTDKSRLKKAVAYQCPSGSTVTIYAITARCTQVISEYTLKDRSQS